MWLSFTGRGYYLEINRSGSYLSRAFAKYINVDYIEIEEDKHIISDDDVAVSDDDDGYAVISAFVDYTSKDDNASAIQENNILIERIRWASEFGESAGIDIKFYFIRGKVEKRVIDIDYMPANQMVTGGLTNSLGRI